MAVYKRSYKVYEGDLTALWSRFLVIPRFIFQDVFASRFTLAFFVGCFIVPIAFGLLIYLHHNIKALELLRLPVEELVAIDGLFFLRLLVIQSSLGFILTVFVGPGLISMDLSNNALPLYLYRPISRSEYVLGKMCVLVTLLSLITWIPGLVLVALQTSLGGLGWIFENWWIAMAVLMGALIWILVLSLITLAVSAWVRWRPVAGAMLFGIFLVLAGFGEAMDQVLGTRWGQMLDIGELLNAVWSWLFRVEDYAEVSVIDGWVGLVLLALASLWILSRRLRAYEVVR